MGRTPGESADRVGATAHDPSGVGRVVTALWAAYLFVLPFHRFWNLRWIGTKFQPPELAFLGLAGAAVVLWWRGLARYRPAAPDAVAAAWLVACLLSLRHAPGHSGLGLARALAESVGGISLVCLYGAVRLTATPRLVSRVGGWFGASAAIAVPFGLVGVARSWFDLPTRLATPSNTLVPYLQHAPRAQAFTAGPQMLASILLLAVPLFIGSRLDSGWRRRDTVITGVLGLGLLVTLSKTAICVVPALAVMWACRPPRGRPIGRAGARARTWLAAATWSLVFLVFTVGSHVMLVRDAEVGRWKAGQVVAGSPLAAFGWRGERWLVMPTTYAYNKWASVLAIEEGWPAGIGPAQQPAFTIRMQEEGRMPQSMWLTFPHSTYLGPAAEFGAPGLLTVILIVVTGSFAIRRLLGPSGPPGWEAAAFAGAGAAFLIEAVSTDLMNCRHYWWFLAVVAARLSMSGTTRDPAVEPCRAPEGSARDRGAPGACTDRRDIVV